MRPDRVLDGITQGADGALPDRRRRAAVYLGGDHALRDMLAGGKVCNPLPQIEGGELGRADLRYIKHPDRPGEGVEKQSKREEGEIELERRYPMRATAGQVIARKQAGPKEQSAHGAEDFRMLEVSDLLNSITRKRAEREVMARDPFLSAAGAKTCSANSAGCHPSRFRWHGR